MRTAVALMAVAFLLAGCSVPRSNPASDSIDASAAASIEESSGAEIPPNNQSVPQTDSLGRTPEESVLALIDAKNKGQWDRLYSLYATPTPDLDNAIREWSDAQERYQDFRVLEVRVPSRESAFVRVAYTATTTPPGGSPYSVGVKEPGEWWPLHMVDGQWKTQWMPRQ